MNSGLKNDVTISMVLTGLEIPSNDVLTLEVNNRVYAFKVMDASFKESGQISDFVLNIEPDPLIVMTFSVTKAELGADFQAGVTRELNKTLAILRLFKVNAIRCIHFMVNDGADKASGLYELPTFKRNFKNIILNETTLNELKAFWACLENIMWETILGTGGRKFDEIMMAYMKFEDATLHHDYLEQIIMDSSIGLEALYSTSKSEIMFRLQLLVAKLFGVLGGNALFYKDLVKAAYDSRSKYAHGEVLDEKRVQAIERQFGSFIEVFTKGIVNVLRISILFWIFMRKQTSHDDLLRLMTDALVDKVIEAELQQHVDSFKLLFGNNVRV